MSRDPIGEMGGLNLYAFVGNNPVKYIDPFGLELSTNERVFVAVVSSLAAVGGNVLLPVGGGGLAGGGTAFLLTYALGGDINESINAGLIGAVGGMGGGYLALLSKGLGARGLVYGAHTLNFMFLDIALLGADPMSASGQECENVSPISQKEESEPWTDESFQNLMNSMKEYEDQLRREGRLPPKNPSR